ncbi:divergent polysaccharide deacetylase family protein [Pseudoalteromonas sp. KG3]|uniref:divergent polysaccharide deacetylase family protein n=1 Tax=Pseudoalteromonas TaxID=53246 RepID=UPI00265A6ED0|nr:divergent polysaccharide deacetylase family protein [Pseudoalteromonas sp. KG3]WKD25358.1 divergent polysaccharide deacetylase family protein [Pseudoalteromonas sp. KG3]
MANLYGVENVSLHVFLDNIVTKQQLSMRISELKHKAELYSFAIAIEHPETIAFLKHAIPTLQQDLELVPLSQLVQRKYIQLAETENKLHNNYTFPILQEPQNR